MHKVKKYIMLTDMVEVLRGCKGGAIEGEQGARSRIQCIYAKKKQENKQGRKIEQQNQDTQI